MDSRDVRGGPFRLAETISESGDRKTFEESGGGLEGGKRGSARPISSPTLPAG
jgi:hypothetical protein